MALPFLGDGKTGELCRGSDKRVFLCVLAGQLVRANLTGSQGEKPQYFSWLGIINKDKRSGHAFVEVLPGNMSQILV